MVLLDLSIVNLALPSIERTLAISRQHLFWVISAYALTFGGFLLLGGRAADLRGRQRVLSTGLALFGVASLIVGLAPSSSVLIVARGLQGLAAALIVPASVSLITTSFAEGVSRNRALGIYGAMFSAGFLTGAVLGGALAEVLSWRYVLAANGLLAILAAVVTRFVVEEGPLHERSRRLNAPAAASATGAVLALVYAFGQAPTVGWASGRTMMFLGIAIVLGALFIAIERHDDDPLVPPQTLSQEKLRAYTAALLTAASAAGALVVLSLYMQEVLGYTVAQAGLAFGAFGIGAVFGGFVVTRLMSSLAVTTLLVVGLLLQACGTLALMSISSSAGAVMFIGTGVLGLGHVIAVVGFTIASTVGLDGETHGLATGVLNTSIEFGAGFGAALAGAFVAAAAKGLSGNEFARGNPEAAMVVSFRHSLLVGVALLVVASFIISATSVTKGSCVRAE